jgi:hypothetical protein
MLAASSLSRRGLLLAGLPAVTPLPTGATPTPRSWRLRMPTPPFFDPTEQPFNRELLMLALQRLGDRVELQRSAPQTWARQLRELESGAVDLAPLPIVPGAYDGFQLRRVDFPLRPGLLGLRLLVVRADRLPSWRGLDRLDALRHQRLGYGSDWADRPLMRSLGFELVESRSLRGLYGLLRSGDCDWLSRGLNELEQEWPTLGGPDLAVLPELALHYPLDDCYFVAPKQEELAQRLLDGLQRKRADGSWLRLLARHYAPLLRRHALGQRRILRLVDYPQPPGLPAELLDAPRWLPALLDSAPGA